MEECVAVIEKKLRDLIISYYSYYGIQVFLIGILDLTDFRLLSLAS